MARVFLSHAAADKSTARRIADALRRGGHQPWVDDENILVGESIPSAIEAGLRTADFVVICLSKAAAAKGWVEAERDATLMQQFRDRRERILPARLEEIAPPYLVASLACVDLFPDDAAFEQGIARLTRSISEYEARRGGSPDVPADSSRGTAGAVVPDSEPVRSAPFHRPVPAYRDATTKALSDKLEHAKERRARLRDAQVPAGDLDREILELREGGRLLAGDTLSDDRYLLVKPAGRGGFAVVWEAFDTLTNQSVAIKVLHSHLAGDPLRRERFFRGARAMVKLAGPAVVRVLEPEGEDGGFHYFVMELVSGGNLSETVLRGRLERADIVPLLLRVSESLATAHAKCMVHRDIKPSNILLDGEGNPKLADFDLVGANDTTGGTRTGALGTLLYSAPECLDRPQEATARADVYGLGMTAIFCFSGRELTKSILRDPDRVIAALQCSPELRAVLSKAVAWEPEDRFADADAMHVALRAVPESSRIEPPASRVEVGPSWVEEALSAFDAEPPPGSGLLAAPYVAREPPRVVLESGELASWVATGPSRVQPRPPRVEPPRVDPKSPSAEPESWIEAVPTEVEPASIPVEPEPPRLESELLRIETDPTWVDLAQVEREPQRVEAEPRVEADPPPIETAGPASTAEEARLANSENVSSKLPTTLDELDVFVLHADADAPFVHDHLLPALCLAPARILTLSTLPVGDTIAIEVEHGVTRSRFIVAVLSPAFLENKVAMFAADLALHRPIDRPRLIPLRLVPFDIPPWFQRLAFLDFTDPADRGRQLRRLERLIGVGNAVHEPIACPYPGSRPYLRSESALFFGREREIQDLVARIQKGEREIYLIGPSGSGKSSLVQAGLFARLSAGSPMLSSFLIRCMRPGEQPMERLAEILGGEPENPSAALNKLHVSLWPPGARVLIFVDQLEELFTAASPREQERFWSALQRLRSHMRFQFVLALRSDFHGVFVQRPSWRSLARPVRLFHLNPVRGAALAESIVAPAQLEGVHVDERLRDQLIQDAAHGPGALAFVQETLRYLWAQRPQHSSRLEAIDASGEDGGRVMVRVVASLADASMARLSEPHRRIARRVLLRLVDLDGGGANVRYPLRTRQLGSAADNRQELAAVLSQLIADRLITAHGDEVDRDATVSLSHRALIEWPVLRDYIHAHRADEQVRRSIDAKLTTLYPSTPSVLGPFELEVAHRWLQSPGRAELECGTELAELIDASRRYANDKWWRYAFVMLVTIAALVTLAALLLMFLGVLMS